MNSGRPHLARTTEPSSAWLKCRPAGRARRRHVTRGSISHRLVMRRTGATDICIAANYGLSPAAASRCRNSSCAGRPATKVDPARRPRPTDPHRPCRRRRAAATAAAAAAAAALMQCRAVNGRRFKRQVRAGVDAFVQVSGGGGGRRRTAPGHASGGPRAARWVTTRWADQHRTATWRQPGWDHRYTDPHGWDHRYTETHGWDKRYTEPLGPQVH